jgi:hypothetical protein
MILTNSYSNPEPGRVGVESGVSLKEKAILPDVRLGIPNAEARAELTPADTNAERLSW